MSDNLGLNQTRVLDTAERSFESVTYQRKKPPLSCEVNLTGKIAAEHAQDVFKSMNKSGWKSIGTIKDSEINVKAGDIVCSSTYDARTFKLMAPTPLEAWVNGMKIVVQGTSLDTTDNKIVLPVSPTPSRADFVFLEVWRKLVTPNDIVYENGNYLNGGANPPNDLIDPAIDIETSLRIQIQYRIRVSECDIESYPEGFDPTLVFLQGPNPAPFNGSNYFTQVPGDPGLWRAGTGDADNIYGTVDGYTYAIPICVVARRNTKAFNPISASNGAGRTLADCNAGLPSDRPDNKYSDYIVADDILDLRHKILNKESMKDLCDSSFRKLIRGGIRGKMSKSLLGEDHYGVTLIQPDGISPNIPGWFNRVGTGDGVRRVFSNAAVTQPLTVVNRTVSQKSGSPAGTPWLCGDNVTIPTSGGSVTSVEDVYITKDSTSIPFIMSPMVAVGNNVTSYSDDGGFNWNSSSALGTYRGVITVGDRFFSVLQQPPPVSPPNLPFQILTSLDGITWTVAYTLSSNSFILASLAWNVDTIVAVGQHITVTSTDHGVTWTEQVVGTLLQAVTWGNGQFIGVGLNGDVSISIDGLTWIDHIGTAGTNYAFSDVLWDGNKYIAVGSDEIPLTALLTSVNGLSWTPQTIPLPAATTNIISITRKNDILVAVGDNGYIITSTNGTVWTQQTSGTTDSLNGVTWTGSQFVAIGENSNTVFISSDGFFWTSQASVMGLKAIASNNVLVSGSSVNINTGSLQSYPLTVNYTLSYPTSQNGFTALPTEILEFRAEAVDSSSIASIDADIPVRTSDATARATLSNRGGSITEYHDFGHQMIYHKKGTGTTQLTFDKSAFGYNILGIASLYDGASYRALTDVTRGATLFTVNSTPVFPLNADMTLNLYTEGKFFQTSKQGRGIVDSFEMKDYNPIEVADGLNKIFHVDAGSKAALKIVSNSEAGGYGIAYIDGIQKTLVTNNKYLPTDSTVSKVTVEFTDAPSALSIIKVPLLTKSAVESSEGYICYYKTLPYQGLLDAETSGIVEVEGSAIVTSSGSGAITNKVSGITGLASFVAGNATVTGTGTNWLSTARVGHYINLYTAPLVRYKIAQVVDDLTLIVSTPVSVTSPLSSYEIYSEDQANFNQANVIDRLPTLSALNDCSGESVSIGLMSLTYPIIDTEIQVRTQDITDVESEKIHIGVNGADRGRAGIHIDGADLGLGNLGLEYSPLSIQSSYQKTYQPYVLNKDSSGELYLMVASSETGNGSAFRYFNEKSNSDTVDIFRLPGRPVV